MIRNLYFAVMLLGMSSFAHGMQLCTATTKIMLENSTYQPIDVELQVNTNDYCAAWTGSLTTTDTQIYFPFWDIKNIRPAISVKENEDIFIESITINSYDDSNCLVSRTINMALFNRHKKNVINFKSRDDIVINNGFKIKLIKVLR